MSNSLLTKKFLSVNREKKKKITVLYNKINTNNKLKIIKKKSLDKHGNTKQWLAPTNLFLQTKTHSQ